MAAVQVVDAVHFMRPGMPSVFSRQQSGPTHRLEIGHWLPLISTRPVQSQLPVVGGAAMSGVGVEQVVMHRPLQQVVPLPQATLPHRHLPAPQCAPPVHATPQPPQLASSDWVSLHPAAAQQALPVGQTLPIGAQPHTPAMHKEPVVQAVPQPPQL